LGLLSVTIRQSFFVPKNNLYKQKIETILTLAPMLNLPIIKLHQQKAEAVKRFHPWIFSGAIKSKDEQVHEGELAEIIDEKGNYLATGYYALGSIAVRVISFKKIESLAKFWDERIAEAYQVRIQSGIATRTDTNVFRLVNAEGDGVPGLIIDFYNGTCVVQAHAAFIHTQLPQITESLQKVLGNKLKAVYDKSETLSKKTGTVSKDHYLLGESGDTLVREYGHTFHIDWVTGQKTGFFIDQRDNRQLLAKYSKGKNILNTFCYTGGFSAYAVKAGAALVHSMDSSAKAIELTDKNIALNNPDKVTHASYCADVFDFLKTTEENFYDVIVLDPPAFAKNHNARHQAVQAYRRLNKMAFDKIKKGGIIFTFSCSQAVGLDLFMGAVTAAAIESGKTIRILHHLSQPDDHPQSIFHPEGMYLKGFVLAIN